MSLIGFYLMPHPPIIIPEVGRGEEEKISATSDSMHRVGREIAEKAPDTIILITPHGPMFRDAVAISMGDSIGGSLRQFNAGSVSMDIPIDTALTSKIFEMSQGESIPAVSLTPKLLKRYDAEFTLDHGSMVPLYFINMYYTGYKLVHITYAPLGDHQLYRFGTVIRKAAEALKRRAVIIASGDLSHRLTEDGPYGYDPDGRRFDEQFLHLLEAGDVKALLNMDRRLVDNAGECGRRSVLVMLGALDGLRFKGDLLSYEGPFGVGYGVMRLAPEGGCDSLVPELEEMRRKAIAEKLDQADPYVRLARESLTTYLETGSEMTHLPDYVTDEMKKERRGVFVSLKKHGDLRGCIGTIEPITDCVAREIIRNAIEAGIYDPRFYEVEKDELVDIDFSVDVLTEPESAVKEELDPRVYGVIVRSGRKRGLLLPDLEGVDTVDKQITIALQKAGINAGEKYELMKFRVIRHTEKQG